MVLLNLIKEMVYEQILQENEFCRQTNLEKEKNDKCQDRHGCQWKVKSFSMMRMASEGSGKAGGWRERQEAYTEFWCYSKESGCISQITWNYQGISSIIRFLFSEKYSDNSLEVLDQGSNSSIKINQWKREHEIVKDLVAKWKERDNLDGTKGIFISKREIQGKEEIHGRRELQRKETQFCK